MRVSRNGLFAALAVTMFFAGVACGGETSGGLGSTGGSGTGSSGGSGTGSSGGSGTASSGGSSPGNSGGSGTGTLIGSGSGSEPSSECAALAGCCTQGVFEDQALAECEDTVAQGNASACDHLLNELEGGPSSPTRPALPHSSTAWSTTPTSSASREKATGYARPRTPPRRRAGNLRSNPDELREARLTPRNRRAHFSALREARQQSRTP
jgi:hypothetical protein